MNPDSSTSGSNPAATYTVVPGDNLYDIARANGISLQEIETANPQIANFDVVNPGDVINLPTGAAPVSSDPAASATTTAATSAAASYTVVPGDNLYDIAQAHGMTLQDIEAANPQIQNFDLIHPGDVVNLGSGGSTPVPVVAPVTDSSGSSATSSSSDSPTTPPTTPGSSVSGASTDQSQQQSNTSPSGGTNSTTTTPDPTQTNTTPVVGGSSDTTSGGSTPVAPDSIGMPGASVSNANNGTTGLSDNTAAGIFSQGSGAIGGFPSSSSYPVPPPDAGSQIDGAVSSVGAPEIKGWGDAGAPAPSDVAKSALEVDTHPKIDPLNVNDKNESPS